MSTAEQYELNKNLAQMLKGGVIMDVTTPEQAKIAEDPGYGQVPDRSFCRGTAFRSYRD